MKCVQGRSEIVHVTSITRLEKSASKHGLAYTFLYRAMSAPASVHVLNGLVVVRKTGGEHDVCTRSFFFGARGPKGMEVSPYFFSVTGAFEFLKRRTRPTIPRAKIYGRYWLESWYCHTLTVESCSENSLPSL